MPISSESSAGLWTSRPAGDNLGDPREGKARRVAHDEDTERQPWVEAHEVEDAAPTAGVLDEGQSPPTVAPGRKRAWSSRRCGLVSRIVGRRGTENDNSWGSEEVAWARLDGEAQPSTRDSPRAVARQHIGRIGMSTGAMPIPRLAALDRLAATVPGIQYAVVGPDGGVSSYARGWADIRARRPMQFATTMMAYSMTQTVHGRGHLTARRARHARARPCAPRPPPRHPLPGAHHSSAGPAPYGGDPPIRFPCRGCPWRKRTTRLTKARRSPGWCLAIRVSPPGRASALGTRTSGTGCSSGSLSGQRDTRIQTISARPCGAHCDSRPGRWTSSWATRPITPRGT